MNFAAIRNAILEKEKSVIQAESKRKRSDVRPSFYEGKLEGLRICRKSRTIKTLRELVVGREKTEMDIASKGDLDAYWEYRGATLEIWKVIALLEGATDENAKPGKRVARELSNALGEEQP
jgi:hypothetical protein